MVKAVICVDPLLKFGCTKKGQEMVFFPPLAKKGTHREEKIKNTEEKSDNYIKRSLKWQEEGMESKTKAERLNLD